MVDQANPRAAGILRFRQRIKRNADILSTMLRSVPIRAAVGLGLAGLAAFAVRAADPKAPEADPWEGKPRAEIIRLLGEPSKAKKGADGRETLTYTFYRIAPDAPPHPDALLLHVPGVGLVARVDRGGAPDPLTLEPPQYDDQGRAAGGGLTRTSSASTSYDPKTGEVSHKSTGPDNPLVAGKVKLRFVLDAGGLVTDWSAPGKP